MQQAESWIGGLLGALANEPQTAQQIRQIVQSGQAGVQPQSIFGDALDWFKSNIGPIAKEAAPIVIQALPAILSALANQPRQQGGIQTQSDQPYQQQRPYNGPNYIAASPQSWN
jgi:hypothetical protein